MPSTEYIEILKFCTVALYCSHGPWPTHVVVQPWGASVGGQAGGQPPYTRGAYYLHYCSHGPWPTHVVVHPWTLAHRFCTAPMGPALPYIIHHFSPKVREQKCSWIPVLLPCTELY